MRVRKPRYFDQFVTFYQDHGNGHFRKHFFQPVLVGIGLVGELDEHGQRGDTATFLAALHKNRVDPASLARRIFLLKVSGYNKGSPHIWLGRSSGNDVVIPEHSLSQIHCRFTYQHGGLYITDNKSHNGTFINDQPVTPQKTCRIRDQDELILGRYKFEYLTAATFYHRIQVSANSVYHTRQ